MGAVLGFGIAVVAVGAAFAAVWVIADAVGAVWARREDRRQVEDVCEQVAFAAYELPADGLPLDDTEQAAWLMLTGTAHQRRTADHP
jgi:hypothetical protein